MRGQLSIFKNPPFSAFRKTLFNFTPQQASFLFFKYPLSYISSQPLFRLPDIGDSIITGDSNG